MVHKLTPMARTGVHVYTACAPFVPMLFMYLHKRTLSTVEAKLPVYVMRELGVG